MLPLTILTAEEAALAVAQRARALRLHRNLTQAGLAGMASVSTASLKRFERTGQVAFVSLVRIAIALDATAALEGWFPLPEFRSIDEALAREKAPQRRRGRRN